jgi:hypothetical protein
MAEEQTKPYRYKGPGKHYHEGRLLAEGEVLQLRQSQAAAVKDRFEPVSGGWEDGDFPVGDVAGTNNTPNATTEKGQNPTRGQQESQAARQATGETAADKAKRAEAGAATPPVGPQGDAKK